jgi:hypothetical protein
MVLFGLTICLIAATLTTSNHHSENVGAAYSLLPIIMITGVASPAFSTTAELGRSIHWFLNPASVNPWYRSIASGSSFASKICVSIPFIISMPICGLPPGGFVAIPPNGHLIQCQPAAVSASAISIAKSIDSEPPTAIAKKISGKDFIRSARIAFCSSVRRLGALNVSNANCASAARAFASAIFWPVSSLYRASDPSAAAASRLWEIIDPAVATPIAVATSAAAITDIISQKSHHSPLCPRNRVEAAAFALLIVSLIGGFIVLIFGVLTIREYRTRR